MKTLTSLVLANGARTSERLIADAIVRDQARAQSQAAHPCLPVPSSAAARPPTHAVLLEGLPDGQGQLEALLAPQQLIRIAPGCLCCSGNLVMRVCINRLLRLKPARLFIALATTSHHPQLRAILQQAPYDQWLTLGEDLDPDLAADSSTNSLPDSSANTSPGLSADSPPGPC